MIRVKLRCVKCRRLEVLRFDDGARLAWSLCAKCFGPLVCVELER